jgi:hypothetical protein
MFNELFAKLNRPEDMAYQGFESPVQGAVQQAQGILANLGNNTPPQPQVEQGGLRGWLSRISQDGGLLQRIGTLGLGLQDAADGGNRVGQQRQMRDQQQARMRLNELANSIAMSPRERLLFQADPEGWVRANESRFSDQKVGDAIIRDGQVVYEAPDDPEFYNTRDGVVRVGQDGMGELVYQSSQEAPTGYRYGEGGNLEYIPGGPADPRVMGAAAASRRAPPRSRAGSVRGASSNRGVTSVAPSSVRWD